MRKRGIRTASMILGIGRSTRQAAVALVVSIGPKRFRIAFPSFEVARYCNGSCCNGSRVLRSSQIRLVAILGEEVI